MVLRPWDGVKGGKEAGFVPCWHSHPWAGCDGGQVCHTDTSLTPVLQGGWGREQGAHCTDEEVEGLPRTQQPGWGLGLGSLLWSRLCCPGEWTAGAQLAPQGFQEGQAWESPGQGPGCATAGHRRPSSCIWAHSPVSGARREQQDAARCQHSHGGLCPAAPPQPQLTDEKRPREAQQLGWPTSRQWLARRKPWCPGVQAGLDLPPLPARY